MTDNFARAFAAVIGHEGGYVDDPRDRGGETKYGISKRVYPHLDIPNLTRSQAGEIYFKDYWKPLGCDEFAYELGFNVFDAGVNSGLKTSARWLQAAVGVTIDGVIGRKTRAAVAERDPQAIIARFNGYRLTAMTDFETWPTHGRGWARRVANNLIAVKG